MKKITVFIFSFIFAVSLLATVSAQCSFGEKNATHFCDISGQMQTLKADGISCENDFECIGGKCLEGTCSHGVASEIAQQKTLLNMILDLFKGPLPVGVKNLTAGEPETFESSASIYEVKIESSKDVQAGVFVDPYETNRPASVNTTPPGKIFEYLGVSVFPEDARDKIEEATIKFKVEKTWFTKNNCNSSSVILYRYIGEEKKWVPLTTKQINETSSAVFYEAKSPGFSTFAITAGINAISPTCGDGSCSGGESQLTCCTDCGCSVGKTCIGNVCITIGQNPGSAATCSDGIKNQGEDAVDCGGPCAACAPECGNGVEEEGENCLNCALDVRCSEGEVCKYKQCVKQSGSILPYIIIIVLIIAGVIVIPKQLKKAKKKNEEMEAKTHSMVVYMIDALKGGMQDSELKERMFKAGWKTNEIEFALKKAKQQAKGEKVKKVESAKK